MSGTWEFKPYRCVGPLKFGMTVDQVKAILGAPVSSKIANGNITEVRENMKLVYDAPKGKLYCINLRAPTPIAFGGSLLFKEKDPIAFLSKLDKETKEGGGYVNFMGLGLLAGGFGKRRIPEGKLLMAYSKAKLKVYTYFTEV
ncbi:MAG: hypothetical protein ABI036_13395 [Fibrobacteria bacterium]